MGRLVVNEELYKSYEVTLSSRFEGALAAAPAAEWPKIATPIESGSESNNYNWLGESQSLRKWLGPRIIKQLRGYNHRIYNEPYELTMSADINELANNAGGLWPMLASRAEIMARAAARQPDELIMQDTLAKGEEIISFDKQPFFDPDHPVGQQGHEVSVSNLLGTGTHPAWYLLDTNRPLKPLIFQQRQAPQFVTLADPQSSHVFFNREVVWGVDVQNAGGFALWQTAIKSTEELTEANFIKARQLMSSYTNDEGVKLGLKPNLLVVPSELQDVARKLFTLEFLANGASNYLKGSIEILVSSYL